MLSKDLLVGQRHKLLAIFQESSNGLPVCHVRFPLLPDCVDPRLFRHSFKDWNC